MCGIVGIYDRGNINAANAAYYSLVAMQHRGQESAGIAINNDGIITCYKDMGFVNEVFDERILGLLKGDMAIGHVRYSTAGASFAANAQPIVVKYKNGNLALSHNGSLINADLLRSQLEDDGMIFSTTTDTEVIAALIARNYKGDIVEAIKNTMEIIKGSYALTILTDNKLIGVRDGYGIRPLVLGKLENGYVLASESCALDTVGAQFIRDVRPGEILVIDETGMKSVDYINNLPKKICLFEHIYFARPDSIIDGISMYKARENAGRILAKEQPAIADTVISVPDSGTPAAIGYANESGIPFSIGLIKNRYVGRTFIQPTQSMRELGVKLKLNPLRDNIKGKRVVMVDDSIVRGTTSKKIVQALRDAGASEVHVRVSSPPVISSCYYGIDTPNIEELIGAKNTIEKVRQYIGADSLGYLSIEGILAAVGSKGEGFCTACLNGEYPI
ncbi:amidophosphoribosyltransferase [Lutispora thermophila]|uniref:Amidophosphoribosyltransferase n=1 Tax=Lutispora thermophila DSM 19022 TaxID=1122184 RepID=A0A1M6AY58_9FIRM|nr:amidophosphoribosyltransferase [Lutispora thermophila]SHI41153.1 amidophosphoribosyltransferase [Lutispora thermophila DSM 19022]